MYQIWSYYNTNSTSIIMYCKCITDPHDMYHTSSSMTPTTTFLVVCTSSPVLIIN